MMYHLLALPMRRISVLINISLIFIIWLEVINTLLILV